MARPARNAYARFLVFSAPTGPILKGSNGWRLCENTVLDPGRKFSEGGMKRAGLDDCAPSPLDRAQPWGPDGEVF
jgi:hypothetical protein